MLTWPRRFPNVDIANQYARKPEKIANKVYSDRLGNGPESSGDGWRYRGRGAIQLTGKSNYIEFAKSVNMKLEDVIPYLETTKGAVESACFFWNNNNLNKFADRLDMRGLTKAINGGFHGLQQRTDKFNKIIGILK
jgi:putative chitinase